MSTIETKCSNCGAKITIDDTLTAYVCDYCGSKFIVDVEAHKKQLELDKKQAEIKKTAEVEQAKNKKTMKIVFIAVAAFVAVAILMIILTATGVISSTTPDTAINISSFTTKVNSDNTLTITKCKVTDEGIVIPEEIGGKKVTAIAKFAFNGNDNVKNITLPKTIKTIETYAFYNLSDLKKVTLLAEDPITTIEKDAFYFLLANPDFKIFVPAKSIESYVINSQNALIIYPISDTEIENTIFTITYDYMFGNKTEKEQFNCVAQKNLLTPNRLGYNFEGWYYSNSFTGTAITVIPKDTQNDVTVYAKWSTKTITIVYDGNNATSGTVTSTTAKTGETITLPANTFVRLGWTFVGWSENRSSTTLLPSEYVVKAISNSSITIYAKWAKEIKTAEDFKNIKEYSTEFYYLQNNISLNNELIISSSFSGIFDGNNYTISSCLQNPFGTISGKVTHLTILISGNDTPIKYD